MAVQAAATSEAQGQIDDAEHARKSTTAVLWLAQLQLAGNVQSCCADNEWAFVDIRGHGSTGTRASALRPTCYLPRTTAAEGALHHLCIRHCSRAVHLQQAAETVCCMQTKQASAMELT